MEEKKAVAEAALYLSEDPLSTDDLADVMNLGSKGFVQDVVDELKAELEAESRGLKLVESDAGYELVVKSDLVDDVEHLAPHRDLNDAERSLERLLEYEFDAGLVFHGSSVLEDAREKLEAYVYR